MKDILRRKTRKRGKGRRDVLRQRGGKHLGCRRGKAGGRCIDTRPNDICYQGYYLHAV